MDWKKLISQKNRIIFQGNLIQLYMKYGKKFFKEWTNKKIKNKESQNNIFAQKNVRHQIIL